MPRLKGVKTNKIKTNKNQDDIEERIKHSCCKYFEENTKKLDVFLKVLNNKTTKKNINVKVIDYFISEYSRKNNIFIDDEAIHILYKNSSKTYSKKNFNPMRRGNKLSLTILGNDINTSVSQINFFKWFTNYSIYDYIEKHLDKIYEDMVSSHEE